MSVLEASELVKAMEEKFGVTAAVAVAAGPAAGGAAGGAAEDEQTEFAVSLDSFDAAKKIGVIKAVKALTNLGLGEAKALVEGAPKVLKEGLSKADADKWIAEITAAGGKASKK
jgi:large subunit ribosomal protein L7/L12